MVCAAPGVLSHPSTSWYRVRGSVAAWRPACARLARTQTRAAPSMTSAPTMSETAARPALVTRDRTRLTDVAYIIAPRMDRPGLVRAIGRWDYTALVVNGVIGSGIFGLPAVLAGLTGAWSPLAYLLAGAGMLTIVLCHAEVASRFREAGGPYLYAREAFGAFVGVQAGWLSFCIRVTSMGANLNIFADYLAQIVPGAGRAEGRVLTLVAVTAVAAWLNVVGVRTGARTVDIFVVAKMLPLLLLVALALPRFSAEVLATQRVASPDWTQAILLLVFAYGGFEAALIPAGEVKDPGRDSAFALLAGLGAVAALYMLVQVSVVGALASAARYP